MVIKKKLISLAVQNTLIPDDSEQTPEVFKDVRPFTVFLDRSGLCAYKILEQMGAPRLGTAHFLPGASLGDKIARWWAQHWPTQPALMSYMAEIVTAWKNNQKTSHSVGSKSAETALRSILDYMFKNIETVEQLCSLFGGSTTVAGTPVPELSRVFDNMSYFERQKYMRENLQKVEEIPENERKPL